MRNYEDEIIQLLQANGNCIDGFNNLQAKGNFHANTLVKHLKNMKQHKLIEIIEIDRQRKRYCIPNKDFAWSVENFFEEFKPITTDLKKKDLSEKEENFLVGSDIRLAFQTLGNLVAVQLYEEHVSHDSKKIKAAEKLKQQLWERIKLNLKRLPLDYRIKVLSALITKTSSPLSLDEYRKTHLTVPK